MLRRKTVRWSAIAAAVVLTVGAVVTLNKSASTAYAVEQTIEAIRGLRFIHVRMNPPHNGSIHQAMTEAIQEAWAQFDENGNLLHMRMNFLRTEDGPKDVVLHGDKAEVWFKAKKSVLVVSNAKDLARLRYIASRFDPKTRAKELLHARDAGELQSETVSTAEGQMIKLTTPNENDVQSVYYVDSTTKLLRYTEKYELDDGQPKLINRTDYLDYNQEPADDVFVLKPPADVMRIDETTQIIGLAKGELTDSEITVKVVREFFEALIAKDYAKAGQLFSGMPASKMEAIFGKLEFVSIISIGDPKPHWIPGVGGMVVSCKVQIERNGKTVIREYKPAVRPVYSQPDRWNIHGGI